MSRVMANLMSARMAAYMLLLVSVATLGSAYIFEYGFGYAPCKLCLYQRIPWWIAIGIASLAINYKKRVHLMVVLTVLGGMTVLVGAVIAGFHVGVEYHWWEGPTSCSGSFSVVGMSMEQMKQAIMSQQPVRCDEIPWSLMGISMAGFNFFISLALGGYVCVAAWLNRRVSKTFSH